MHVTQVLHQNVQRSADRTATVFGERTRTWVEMIDRVARLAAGLRARGLETEGRVAILADNSDRYLECVFAVQWAGGVIVPVNTRWSEPEIRFVLDDCTPAFLVVDDSLLPMADRLRRQASAVAFVHMGEERVPDGYIGFEDLIASHEPMADVERGAEDLSGIYYTGGTTGRSKGVMLPQRSHTFNSVALVATTQIPDDIVYLHVAPMFHIADAQYVYAAPAVGAKQIVLPKFDPKAVCEAVETHAVTDTVLVPTMVGMLLNFPDRSRYDLTSLKRLFYGGSPMPEALLLKLFEALPECAPIQLYGQTESGPVLTALDSKYHTTRGPFAGKLRTAGRALIGVDVKIVDETGAEVPRGTAGEIIARGPHIMRGYWNLPEQTAAALRDGWLHTGDVAVMDEEGFITICDRLKDMIISGGENVYSTEVENALYTHPAVQSCAVIGLPDETWGERVHAVIVPRDGVDVDPDDLVRHCRTQIAGYKCPRSITIRRQPMPMSGAGKILKTALRKEYGPA